MPPPTSPAAVGISALRIDSVSFGIRIVVLLLRSVAVVVVSRPVRERLRRGDGTCSDRAGGSALQRTARARRIGRQFVLRHLFGDLLAELRQAAELGLHQVEPVYGLGE